MVNIKWGIPMDEPEDEEYEPYDGPLPPAGVFYARVPRMILDESSAGNEMFVATLVLDDPRDGKRQYDGYVWTEYVVMTPQSLFRAKQMARSLGVSWRELETKTNVEKSGDRPTGVKSIGKVKFGGAKDPRVRVQVRRERDDSGEYGDRLRVARWLSWRDPDALEDDADEDSGVGEPEDDGIVGDDEDATDDTTPEEPEEPWTQEELEALNDDELLEVAEGFEITDADEMASEDLVDAILEAQDAEGDEPEDDDDDGDDDDGDDDPRRAELEEMTRGQLVKTARSLGIKPIRSSMSEEDLVDAILEREEDDGVEAEPEPEPKPRRTRKSAPAPAPEPDKPVKRASKRAPSKSAPAKRASSRRRGGAPF